MFAEANFGFKGIVSGVEIINYDLRGTDLVVLSGGQTSKGAKLIEYAFQLAGARSIVDGLGNLPDTATALVTIDFFKNLADGCDKAEALCKAQRSMLAFRRDLLLEDIRFIGPAFD